MRKRLKVFVDPPWFSSLEKLMRDIREKNCKNALRYLRKYEFCSYLKLVVVLVLTLGYQRPADLISVLRCLARSLNSLSTPVAEPHSANCRKPSVATWSLPQKEKFGSCDAPITSLKWVSQAENGKSFGWVRFDQMPSIVNWKTRDIYEEWQCPLQVNR